MKRSWVMGAAAAVVLVGVVALAVVRGRPQPGKPEPPRYMVSPPSAADVDSVLPSPLRTSLERPGLIDAILTNPRLNHEPETKSQIHLLEGVGILFRSPFVRLGESQARRLRESMLRVHQLGGVPTDCVFMPDIAFRFGASPDSLRIIVCHGCGETKVLSTKGTWGRMLGFESDTLLALTSELFPNDARIADYRSQRAGR